MAIDFHLLIEGTKSKVKGEGSGEFKDQIQITKFTVGGNSPTDYDGQAAGRVHLEHAEFEFEASVASPVLYTVMMTNETLKTVTVTCRKTGMTGKLVRFLQWRFANARIVSLKMTGENEKVGDTMTIAYAAMEVWCGPQCADGSIGSGTNATWDSSENKASAKGLPDPPLTK